MDAGQGLWLLQWERADEIWAWTEVSEDGLLKEARTGTSSLESQPLTLPWSPKKSTTSMAKDKNQPRSI